MDHKLNNFSLDEKIALASQLADDFSKYIRENKRPPDCKTYRIQYPEEPKSIGRSARIAAWEKIQRRKIKKIAFDTRHINQELDRIPRSNLQYWHRTDEFITQEDQIKIERFANLHKITAKLKDEFGARPDWHNSYARVLHDALERILRIKLGDNDFDRAQLAYLEQLLDARYKLSMEDLENKNQDYIKTCLLKKDENLLKRGIIGAKDIENNFADLLTRAMNKTTEEKSGQNVINVYPAESKNNDTNQVLANLFGSGMMRRDGEKSVTRTITVTIKDSADE